MTFSEFLEKVDVKDFNSWFDSKNEVIYTKSDVWKYYIKKNEKMFPFKTAIKTYLKDRNLGEIENFKSNDNTRVRFSERFGIKIHEELFMKTGKIFLNRF